MCVGEHSLQWLSGETLGLPGREAYVPIRKVVVKGGNAARLPAAAVAHPCMGEVGHKVQALSRTVLRPSLVILSGAKDRGISLRVDPAKDRGILGSGYTTERIPAGRKENAGMLRCAQHDKRGCTQPDRRGRAPRDGGRLGRVLLAGLAVVFAARTARAAPPDPQLDAGFRAMYALDFVSSQKSFADYERAHPEDSLGYAAEMVGVFFNEMNRLKLLDQQFSPGNESFFAKPQSPPDPQVRARIMDLSARARQMAEAKLRAEPGNEPALFALALTYGILGDYAALIDRHYWTSVKYGRQGEQYARRLLQQDPQFYDAYVWLGVSNFIYGSLALPLRWTARLFGLSGDKATGVANLQLAADKGAYLKPYAKVLLAIAYLREKNRPAAATLLAELSTEFPSNPLFAAQARRLATDK